MITEEDVVDQRLLAHGEGQMHALKDVADILERHFGLRCEVNIDQVDTYLESLARLVKDQARIIHQHREDEWDRAMKARII